MEELYLICILNSNLIRISTKVIDHPALNKTTLERAHVEARAGALYYGEEYTYKVYKLTETEPYFKDKE